MHDLEQALAVLKRDPTRPVRVRVGGLTVELRTVNEAPASASSIVGLFSEEPELMDEVCEQAMTARERDPLRRSDA